MKEYSNDTEIEDRIRYTEHIDSLIDKIFLVKMQCVMNNDPNPYLHMINSLETLVAGVFPTEEYKKRIRQVTFMFESQMQILKMRRTFSSSSKYNDLLFQYAETKLGLLLLVIKKRGMLPRESEYSEL